MPSMTFELAVEMDDGRTFDVVADQRDIARWEVQPFGWPIVKMEDHASMGFFRFLAWSAATRQGHTTEPWADFDAHCVEAMPPDDEDGEGSSGEGEGGVPDDADDPGRPAPSGTPSSRSRERAAKP